MYVYICACVHIYSCAFADFCGIEFKPKCVCIDHIYFPKILKCVGVGMVYP